MAVCFNVLSIEAYMKCWDELTHLNALCGSVTVAATKHIQALLSSAIAGESDAKIVLSNALLAGLGAANGA